MQSGRDALPQVLIFDSYYATLGGNQRYIAMLLLARDWGWRAALCCPGEGPLTEEARAQGADVHVVPQSPRLDRGRAALRSASPIDKLMTAGAILAYNFKLAAKLREIRPDAIQCHSTRNVVMAGLAALIARVPLVFFSKGEMMSPLADRLALWTARTTAFISPHLRPDFSTRAVRKNPSRFPTLRIGIPMNAVDAAEERVRATQRSGPDENSRPITFAFAGWLVKTKGVHRLIEAFAELHATHPDTRLLIAGESDDEPYKQRLHGMVVRNDLSRAVTFLGWRDDILDVLAAADVYVLPSFTEGVPRSIVETMAMGKAVIATTVGGIPELLGHGDFGLLCPPDDVSALARAMKKVVEAPDMAARMGASARQEARQRYSFQAHLRELEAILTNSVKSNEKSDSYLKTGTNS